MWNLKSNTNKQNSTRLIHTENKLMVVRGKASWGVDEKVKRLRSTDQLLQNIHGDTKYSIGNIVNNVIITMYGATWSLGISGEILCKVHDCLTTMLYT